MRKKLLSKTAVTICLLCIIGTLIVERNIYVAYQATTGKSRALFGLSELLNYSYKYLFTIGGLIGFIFIIIAFRKKESEIWIWLAFIISVGTIVLPILNVWHWFVE